MEGEIKHRIWDSKNNCFASPDTYSLSLCGQVATWDDGIHPEPERFTVERYTGWEDMNGKPIYEGDFVKSVGNHEQSILAKAFGHESVTKYTLGEVKFYNAAFFVCQKFIGSTDFRDFTCCWEHAAALEIIGNVHENPELVAQYKCTPEEDAEIAVIVFNIMKERELEAEKRERDGKILS